jgi:hypothetical protein
MSLLHKGVSLLALSASLAPAAALADDGGRLILESRLRYEAADQSNLPHQANALTLRTRLGWETAKVADLRLLVEGEANLALVDRYADGVTPRPGYPVVADPDSIELNRAQISWSALPRTEVVAGRQRIVLGDARFVGNSGFRQNEQTFDAVRVTSRPVAPLTLTYAYVGQVQRVLGNESATGQWHGETHLMQADLATPLGQASAYGFLLEFDNAPGQSSQTFGARLGGARPLGHGLSATYEIEYAHQSDYRNNPAGFGLDYWRASAGAKTDKAALALVYERLEGDGAHGFQTPLATLHAFQGWADVLTTTPGSGVRDLYLRASTTVKPFASLAPLKLKAEAHDFDTTDGSPRIGRELDLSAGLPLSPHLTAEVAGADFQAARAPFADVRRLWLTLEYKY